MSINDDNNKKIKKRGTDADCGSLPAKIKEFLYNYLFDKSDTKQNSRGSEKQEKSEKSEKKTINTIVIWICVGAIIIMFAVHMFSADDNQNTQNGTDDSLRENVSSVMIDGNVYASDMERDLKEILEKINGAGSVSVRIYINSTSEKVLAENTKSESNLSEHENERTESSSSERNAVMSSGSSGLGSSGSPYVVSEKLPYPIGVLVVAEGAKNERVRMEMYEAVKALYGLSANRIKITY